MSRNKLLLLLITVSAYVMSCDDNLQLETPTYHEFQYLELSSSPELQDVIDRFKNVNSSGRVSSFLDSVDFSHANKRVDDVTNITYYDFNVFNVKNLVYSKFVLREREDGKFYGTLLENEFDKEWVSRYDSFPGWNYFTGYFRMYDIYGSLISENRMENGQSIEDSGGRVSSYTCVSSTVDWYTCSGGCHYDYTEVTTTCGWESYEEYYCDDMGCTDNQTGGVETLNFGDYTPPKTFQCSINTIEDLNGNCVEKPCPGNPLLDMEISQWNNSKNSNRFGCYRVDCDYTCNSQSCRRKHNGIDLRADIGTEVHSTIGGSVWAIWETDKLGNYVIIKTGKYYHLYAHLDEKPNLDVGTLVEQGAMIGISGDSGNASGKPHLHYEVKYQNGSENYTQMEFRNPESFISANYDTNGNIVKNCN